MSTIVRNKSIASFAAIDAGGLWLLQKILDLFVRHREKPSVPLVLELVDVACAIAGTTTLAQSLNT